MSLLHVDLVNPVLACCWVSLLPSLLRLIMVFQHLLALALLVVLSNFAHLFQAMVQASRTEAQMADITMDHESI